MAIKLNVLYGSETGTAQDTAEQIWKQGTRYKYSCKISSLDDYNIEELPSEKMVVFVVSTTGQGAMPTNMRKFWKFLLNKKLSKDSLSKLNFCVLGLGDRSYQKFNFAARKLQNRLVQLGAKPFMEIALADDQDELGIDSVVIPFMETFFKTWNKINDVKPTDESPSLIPKFEVNVLKEIALFQSFDIFEGEKVSTGDVISNCRITADDHFQDVRLMKIFAKDLNYKPGDVFCVRPRNSKEKVKKFFRLMKENCADIKEEILIQLNEIDIAVPTALKRPVTLEQLVEQYWDLSMVPTRTVMENLALISDDEMEKSRLFEFCQPGGLDDLYSYVNRPRRSVLEVLHDFPKTVSKLTVTNLFEVLIPIRYRSFSIASSLKFSDCEIHILMAVVKYKTKLFEPRLGLCSNWLAQHKPEDKIHFWIQPGTFVFNHDHPMILIGPGTGVAPFRSLLLEKIAEAKELDDCVLFFGCRYKEKDYHCQDDFKMMEKHGLKMFCAFSRDQENKIYVQHLIRKESKLLWNFLSRNAYIYLAGNAKNMPKAVREEFVNIAVTEGDMELEKAESYIDYLEQSNRYQSEIWA